MGDAVAGEAYKDQLCQGARIITQQAVDQRVADADVKLPFAAQAAFQREAQLFENALG